MNNIMLVPCDKSGSPPDQNVHWERGLLIDFDYSFLYECAVKKLMEISLHVAKEHKNGLVVEEAAQATDNDILHRTVSIFIQRKPRSNC